MAFVAMLGIGAAHAKNRTLLIGIGAYDRKATGWTPLHGDNDVALLEKKQRARHYDVVSLTDAKATKAGVTSALSRLVANVATGDNVYLHFSGHGQLVQDMNGDEANGYDQTFVCFDACFSPNYKTNGKWYRGQNHLVDDELFPYLSELKRKVGKTGSVMVVFDACYSGGAERGNVEDDPDPDSEVEWSDTVRGTDDEFPMNESSKTYLRSLKRPGTYPSSGGTLTVISACGSEESNYECKEPHSGRRYGSLSFCIGKLLDSNVAMSTWGDYFAQGKHGALKILRPTQHPVVKVY